MSNIIETLEFLKKRDTRLRRNNEKCIAVIPAKGFSSGVPFKNLFKLDGKPLLQYTLEAACASEQLDDVVVSTESEEIYDFCQDFKVSVLMRPKELAQPAVHASRVITHVLEHSTEKHGLVAMLLPTAPFRGSADIDFCINILRNSEYDAVIGICELEKPLQSLRWRRHDGTLLQVAKNNIVNFQRDEVEPLLAVNGAMFLTYSEILIDKKTFHVENAYGYLMDSVSSFEADSLDDIKEAERLLWSNKYSG